MDDIWFRLIDIFLSLLLAHEPLSVQVDLEATVCMFAPWLINFALLYPG